MQTEAPNEIVISRVVKATQEQVWHAMTDPLQVVKWWGPAGFTTVTEVMDVRVDGHWKHTMIGPDGTRYPNKSIFKEVVPFERIVYHLGGGKEHGKGANFVATWTFEPVEDGTRVTIRMVFPTAEDRNFVATEYGAVEGGHQTLARLDDHLADLLVESVVDAGRGIVTTRDFAFPREQVFAAWTQAELLATWWGPKGFTNTFEEFNPQPGGHWRFIMHGPDGTDYPNHSIFADIVKPQRIVFDHMTGHHFEVTALFTEHAGQTRLTWRMRFDTTEECDKIRAFVVNANEENMDKLQRCLETQGTTRA